MSEGGSAERSEKSEEWWTKGKMSSKQKERRRKTQSPYCQKHRVISRLLIVGTETSYLTSLKSLSRGLIIFSSWGVMKIEMEYIKSLPCVQCSIIS
jgi:hypothetical protein